jgi:hypothetical protein
MVLTYTSSSLRFFSRILHSIIILLYSLSLKLSLSYRLCLSCTTCGSPLKLVRCMPCGALPVNCMPCGLPPIDSAPSLNSPSHCASGATTMASGKGFPLGRVDRKGNQKVSTYGTLWPVALLYILHRLVILTLAALLPALAGVPIPVLQTHAGSPHVVSFGSTSNTVSSPLGSMCQSYAWKDCMQCIPVGVACFARSPQHMGGTLSPCERSVRLYKPAHCQHGLYMHQSPSAIIWQGCGIIYCFLPLGESSTSH